MRILLKVLMTHVHSILNVFFTRVCICDKSAPVLSPRCLRICEELMDRETQKCYFA